MEKQVNAIETWANRLEEALDPVCSGDLRTLNKGLAPVDRAVTHLCLAKAALALFECYLRATGTPMQQHFLQTEQARLQVYQQKVDKAAAAWYLSEHRPTTQVNVAAANRFISHAIPELSQEQRQALKQAGADSGRRKWARNNDAQMPSVAKWAKQAAAEEATDALLANLRGAL